MKQLFSKKKESGAEGRKRRKLQEEEAARKSTQNKEEEDINLNDSECDEIKISEATSSKTIEKFEKNINISVEDKAVGDCMVDDVENPITVIPEIITHHDIGLLIFDKNTGKPVMPDGLNTEIIKMGSKYFQNTEGPFLPTNNHCMNKSWFKKKLGNCGEEVTRSWLVYSPSKKSAFCICCLIFSQLDNQTALEHENEFTQWKAPERLTAHENAKNHRQCFTQWKEMERNFAVNKGIIDAELQTQIETEKQTWRNVLKRIIHCIKFLATQNLALRGHRESLRTCDDESEPNNVGNFLGLIKLLATFDPVINTHLTQIKNHPRTTSYFSPSVQNEFIHLMATTVRQSLLRTIRKSKYYGLMFDSTADQAHHEQMSEVVRYVKLILRENQFALESFLGFIQISQKDAGSLVDEIFKQLETDDMNLQDCRSQCYDNAAVMAGHRFDGPQHVSIKE
ncbi:Zinc finger MYM-type protein 1 [Eumeta japonica]|uniref:Zinc finger MYM-type protein 1 n=1 Tax=Eumeta variegata TaxID=151549 RepID=A0A4C1Y6X9_EUMVA|nr:Zinc finger MYM-type protein 1 [Eumeta japonica]